MKNKKNKIDILSNQTDILSNLASNANVLHQSATVKATYGASNTVTSLTLPEGFTYLILGQVQSSVNDTASIVSAQIGGSSGPAPMCRGTMNSGGGADCWAFTRGGRTITLLSYGYKNATYNLSGHILALPIYVF